MAATPVVTRKDRLSTSAPFRIDALDWKAVTVYLRHGRAQNALRLLSRGIILAVETTQMQ